MAAPPSSGMGNAPPDPAVTVSFGVRIDGHELGSFMTCEGLSVEVSVETREEGGNNAFVHQLPGRMSYSNITLTRPVNQDSAKVAQWLGSMQPPIKRTTAEIRAMSIDDKPIATWSLRGVIPVKWSGPSLGADGPKIAVETLELAHHGFLT